MAGSKKRDDSSFPKRSMEVLVIFPLMLIFALSKKVISSQVSI
jgi:hypothetical protein